MAKKEKKEEEAADWMGTYGDMVTLLLCFFVLLYAMSTMDVEKWNIIVRAFNSDAISLQDVNVSSSDSDDTEGGDSEMIPELTTEDIANELDALFMALSAAVQSADAQDTIEVTQGDGFVFVSFHDAVFFDGDSYVLRPDGEAILNMVLGPLEIAARVIDEIRVMGHTAQARVDVANDPTADRLLASGRSATVVAYLQQTSQVLNPARLVNMGYGQWRPIDSNETAESRSNNRRVEMMVTGLDLESELGDALEQYNSLHE